MKKFYSFLILCIFILFLACQEKEDPFNNNLIGTWEIANYDSLNEWQSVISYTFRSNGTYDFELFSRDPESGENLSFILIWKGEFRSTLDQLTLMPQEIFYPPIANNGVPLQVDREGMVKRDFTPGQRTSYRYDILQEGNQLLIYALPPADSSTAPSEDLLFKKVK
ncbi:MAG: hypothetical protein ACXIUQ_08765 [Cecembia sp.]